MIPFQYRRNVAIDRGGERVKTRLKLCLPAALILAALTAPALAQSPATFPAAKRLLAGIHQEIGHLRTVYCACPYVRTTRSGGDIDREACGLEARRNERRSDRVEWEHVVPASWFGSQRSCWKSGHALCGTKKNGNPRKGRACCLKPGVDPAFQAAHIWEVPATTGRRYARYSARSWVP